MYLMCIYSNLVFKHIQIIISDYIYFNNFTEKHKKIVAFWFLHKTFLPPVFSIICIVHTSFSSNLVRATISKHFRTPLILPNPGPLPLQWDQQIKYGKTKSSFQLKYFLRPSVAHRLYAIFAQYYYIT